MRWIAGTCVAALLVVPAAGARSYRQRFVRVELVERDGLPLARRFSASQIAAMEKLNRADVEHLDRLKAVVVPESWPFDDRMLTNLPQWYGPARAYPKLVVVHVPGQIFGAYEFGGLVRWGPVSTGIRGTQTPAGWFHLNWRASGRVSTVNPDWFLKSYFNFGNEEGLAFHEYALPGHPASHGCVRLLARDAQWLFGWGDPWALDRTGQLVVSQGTPVLIIGVYDFDSPPPWRSLSWLATSIELPTHVPPAEAGEISDR